MDGDRVSESSTLRGILAMLAADHEERARPGAPVRSSEAILSAAGLSNAEIGAVLGKSTEAVRSTLRRGARTAGGAE